METPPTTKPLNTATLQKEYPEIYREFFSSCDFVFSAPATLLWCGEIAARFGGISCAQKIPRRVYIGIKMKAHTQSNDLHFTDILIIQSKWESHHISDVVALTSEIEKYLLHQYHNLGGSEIKFLYEFPYGIGYNTATSLGVALAFALSVLEQQRPNIIKEIAKHVSLLEFIHNTEALKLIRRAFHLRSLFTTRVSEGHAGILASLLPYGFPIISANQYLPEALSEPFNRTNRWPDLPTNREQTLQAWYLHGLEGSTPYLSLWPIDLARISLGRKAERGFLIDFFKEQQILFKKIREMYAANLLFLNNIQDPWNHYIQLLDLLATQTISALHKLLQSHTYEAAATFANTLQRQQHALALIGNQNTTAKQFLAQLETKAQQLPEPHAYRMNDDWTSCLIIGPLGSLDGFIPSFVHQLQNTLNTNIHLEWASWRDGFESDGARVEQAPSLGVIHPLLKSGTGQKGGAGYTITLYNSDGAAEEKKMRQLDPNVADLFLDEVREKVWCAGKPVSAEELPSQRMAITLLKQLAHSENSRLANTDLPRSSYTSYRNELQSKIISPLRKLVEKRLRKELALNIEGSLTKFHIVRGKDDLTIAIRHA